MVTWPAVRSLDEMSLTHSLPGIQRAIRSKVILAGAVLASTVLVTACGGPTQEMTVTMTDDGWSVSPETVGDAATFEFRFVNESSTTHHPIVVSSELPAAELEASVEEHGTERLILDLVSSTASRAVDMLVYPGEESGRFGHFHPGSGSEPDLPPHALVVELDAETVAYLHTLTVDPGDELVDSVTCCKPGTTFGNRGAGTTFLVLSLDRPDNYAIYELVP